MQNVSLNNASSAVRGRLDNAGYLVQRGDTLSDIAREHGVTLAQLLRANPQIRDSNHIAVGQQIRLPQADVAPGKDYTVKAGDSLWDIAQRNGISVQELEAANPQLKADRFERIFPGDVLRIPPAQTGKLAAAEPGFAERALKLGREWLQQAEQGIDAAGKQMGAAADRLKTAVGELVGDKEAKPAKAAEPAPAKVPAGSEDISKQVWQPLNQKFGTKVDFAAVSQFEGKQRLDGYVPMSKGKVAGRSGVTIATGWDIGQMSKQEIKALGLPPALEQKVLPYAGKVKSDAVEALKAQPLAISRDEANLIDQKIKAKHLDAAIRSWDAGIDGQPPKVKFAQLTAAQQTVLFSRTFHQGVGMPNTATAQDFYAAAQRGDWQLAEAELRDYPAAKAKWYQNRVNAEADLLKADNKSLSQ